MNKDLNIVLPGETVLEYYKRVRIVLEDRIKGLEKQNEILKKIIDNTGEMRIV